MRDIQLFKKTRDLNRNGIDYVQTYYSLKVNQYDKEIETIGFLLDSDLLELKEQINELLEIKE